VSESKQQLDLRSDDPRKSKMKVTTGVAELAKKLCDITGVPRYLVRQNLFELKMMCVRLYGLARFQHFRIRQLQRGGGNLQLIFGCGETRYPGWVGVDCVCGKAVDLLLDLRRRLPFSDCSVNYCYSEHFLEHLYPEEAKLHLAEAHRILVPGGVYRVVVPAGVYFVKKYLEGDLAFFRLAHPWEERPLDAVYKVLNWSGQHRSIFDFPQLEYLARNAGFSEARECRANQSTISLLRIDRSEPQRIAESLYAELVKA
jgi:predicted SAM-dependent methyltransferase